MQHRWYRWGLIASLLLMHGCTTKTVESTIGISPTLLEKSGQLSYVEFVKQWRPQAVPQDGRGFPAYLEKDKRVAYEAFLKQSPKYALQRDDVFVDANGGIFKALSMQVTPRLSENLKNREFHHLIIEKALNIFTEFWTL